MSVSVIANSSSASSSAASPTSTKSYNSKNKTGRPGKWFASRQRKLARLYLYTNLPREDIPLALKVENGNDKENWLPGKESTTQTVNSILDKEPRWLRPKDREDMDRKILGLSECKKQRKTRRPFSPPSSHEPHISNIDTPFNFTETPLEYLLAFAPAEPFKPLPNLPTATSTLNYSLSFSTQDVLNDEEPIQFPSMTATAPDIAIGMTYPMYRTRDVPDVDEASLLSTYLSITSLKNRLSRYSTSYVKAIARVVKTHSIADSSAASTMEVTFPITAIVGDASTEGTATIRSSGIPLGTVKPRSPKLILPDSILLLDRHVQKQGLCIPGLKSHDSKTCWCLDELDFRCDIWVSHAGLVCDQLQDPPRSLGTLHCGFRDVFGNTLLHMLAARGANFDVILAALQKGVDGNAKNTAGQNFLHVLSRQWLTELATSWNVLELWLQRLNAFYVRFFDYDVFGRNFFHILTRRARRYPGNDLEVALDYLNVQLPRNRDAFDWVAMSGSQAQQDCYGSKLEGKDRHRNPEEQQQIAQSSPKLSYAEELAEFPAAGLLETLEIEKPGIPMSPPSKILTVDNRDALINHHKQLLATATRALHSSRAEDAEGRNGLQCLAEASLHVDELNTLLGHSTKRKRGQSSPSGLSKSLTFRDEIARTMILFGVDVNHYDKSGNNVLMSFVTSLPDGEDDKTLSNLLRRLIESGANVHSRNRSGETALHVAVRLGRKVATKILLERGANVHARTSEGKGVLRLGEMHYFRAREAPKLYAGIMACMALCIEYGAVATPTLVMEWKDENSGFI